MLRLPLGAPAVRTVSSFTLVPSPVRMSAPLRPCSSTRQPPAPIAARARERGARERGWQMARQQERGRQMRSRAVRECTAACCGSLARSEEAVWASQPHLKAPLCLWAAARAPCRPGASQRAFPAAAHAARLPPGGGGGFPAAAAAPSRRLRRGAAEAGGGALARRARACAAQVTPRKKGVPPHCPWDRLAYDAMSRSHLRKRLPARFRSLRPWGPSWGTVHA